MKKILITDDNENNRLLLRIMLEEYGSENGGVVFEISEAQNGIEAVSLAVSKAFDLIFMDIMMPEMDGIEATKQIRRNNKEVMIIAVSAIADEGRKKEILNAGAEDYIAKPVDCNIFHSRITMYLSLIDSRHPRAYNVKAANLYTQKVFSRQTLFTIYNEDTLSEFWEYYLLEEGEKCDGLSDLVRVLNSIGALHVKAGLTTRIIVEESEEKFFFTIEDIDKIQSAPIERILEKNAFVQAYKTDKKRMSFMLLKLTDYAARTVEPSGFMADARAEPAKVTTALQTDLLKTSKSDIHVYDYLDPEDLDEIKTYVGKLDSLFLVAGESDLTQEEVSEIYTYLERISRMMTTYTESYNIGQAISILSQDIAAKSEVFKENSAALAPMCAAFNRDLSTWIRMMFYEGSPSVDYMDDTIIANTQTIGSMLKMDEAPAHDDAGLDDIFDF